MSTDRDWISWGEHDPYFAVLTQDKYRGEHLDDQARREFFEEGALHLDRVLGVIRKQLAADFAPRSALDFGCGVGRLLVPMTELPGVRRVVGVDIAPRMLDEAQRNCPREHLDKLELVRSDDRLSQVVGQFDLVHSCIVLQHIPAERGIRLFAALLDRVGPRGVAALHVLYGKESPHHHLGRESAFWRFASRFAARLRALLQRLRPGRRVDPVMEMNAYDLGQVAYLLQRKGFSGFHAEFTDHGGVLGVMIYATRDNPTGQQTTATKTHD